MAALHEIARQYAEEIRDGIAWVIYGKLAEAGTLKASGSTKTLTHSSWRI